MKSPCFLCPVARHLVSALLIPALVTSLFAQAPATGVVEGRVFDASRGEYLERVRVTIEGTSQETFTDFTGAYRLGNVTAGTVQITAFYTGLSPHSETLSVRAGQTVQHEIVVRAGGAGAKAGAPVKLDAVVIDASREIDGIANAIHIQRFASNMVNVVPSDLFGTIVDGTPGEAMKFLPGVTMDYSAGEPRNVSLNGVPASYVPITVGGFELASAASNGMSRVTHLDQFAVNNISRIEVHHSPTPEMTGSALAGSVNMVPRSAFERARPLYSASAFLMMKDNERHFKRTPGPLERSTRKITPGFNFSAIVPVNDRFGYTLSGSAVHYYSPEDIAASTWRGVSGATNGTTLPDTTPANPYLTDFNVRDNTRDNRIHSVGLTVDYKLTRESVLSFAFQYTYLGVLNNNRTLSFFVNEVAADGFGPTFTRGAPGQGEIRIQGSQRDWLGTTATPTLVWRHYGPVWSIEAGAGYSRASLHVRGIDKGWFVNSQARRTGVTVAFADVFYLRPNTISVTDLAGRPVDPYNLDNYALTSANDEPRDSVDVKRSVYANARRHFTLGGQSVALKGGWDWRTAERDLSGSAKPFNFIGADGRPSTGPGGDDGAGLVLDEGFSQRVAPFGFPKVQWMSNEDYYALYKARPEYFALDENGYYRSLISTSKRAREEVLSAYARADAAFFQRRLQLIGGVRAEQTNIDAEGPLTDPTRNFQRRPDGSFVVVGGVPAFIAPPADALAVSRLTFLSRGQQTKKEYLRFFPNLNASFRVRENIILRGVYYHSLGRPDFNQYAGGLTLPETHAGPGPGNPIRVNNAAIKPWTARTAKVRLEYYFQGVGQITAGVFRREFENFFGATVFPATADFLALHDLDSAVYGGYDVVTQHNLPDTVRMTGVELDYRQPLAFLPHWARGLQVFANASTQRAVGPEAGNFAGFIPRTVNWGASLTRPRFALYANWNYRSAQRRTPVTGRGIESGTFNWGAKRMYIDVIAEYRLRNNISAFANLRNINDATEDQKVYGPNTPLHARFRQRTDYAAAWTMGIKGSY